MTMWLWTLLHLTPFYSIQTVYIMYSEPADACEPLCILKRIFFLPTWHKNKIIEWHAPTNRFKPNQIPNEKWRMSSVNRMGCWIHTLPTLYARLLFQTHNESNAITVEIGISESCLRRIRLKMKIFNIKIVKSRLGAPSPRNLFYTKFCFQRFYWVYNYL